MLDQLFFPSPKRVFGMQITIPACLLVDTSFYILHLRKGHYKLHWISLFTLKPYFFTANRRYIEIPNLPFGEISTIFNSIQALGEHNLISRGGRWEYIGEERKLNMRCNREDIQGLERSPTGIQIKENLEFCLSRDGPNVLAWPQPFWGSAK